MMKPKLLNLIAFFTLILFTLASCMKEDLSEDEIGIDPDWSRHSATWKETERKSGMSDWMTLPNGNSLELWWEYPDSSKNTAVGIYRYKSANFGIHIDTTGYMEIKKDVLSFISANTAGGRDTIAKVEYLNYGDTLLVIRNKSVMPVSEIRYKKIK